MMPTIPDAAVCPTCGRLVQGTPGLDRVLAEIGYVYYDATRRRTVYKKRIDYCRCKTKPTQAELWWMKE